MYVSHRDKFVKAGCSEEFSSDHFLIFGVYGGRMKKPQALVKFIRNMKNCCRDDLVSDLLNALWSVVDTFDSTDDKWNCWKLVDQSVLDRHARRDRVFRGLHLRFLGSIERETTSGRSIDEPEIETTGSVIGN